MKLAERLASFLFRRRRRLLFAWLGLLVAAAGLLAAHPGDRAETELSGAPGTEAHRVLTRLERDFGTKLGSSADVVTRGALDARAFERELGAAFPQIGAVTELKGNSAHRERLFHLQFRPELSLSEAQALTPGLRGWLGAYARAQRLELAQLTGSTAFQHDAKVAGKKDSKQGEALSLAVSLGVLVLTFGSLSATLIPLTIGGSTLLLFNALIVVLHLPVNPVSRILSGLVGLGLAIDYTVFMVSRFKEEVRGAQPVAEAVRRTLAYPGRTVFFSALVMAASIGALWLPDVSLSRTVVIDLLAVVGVSLVNTVVMGPVLLALRPDWLDRPRWLSRWIAQRHAERFWRGLAQVVVRHPKRAFALALGVLLLLALPATRMKLWEPVMAIAPRDSESMRAYQLLARDGWGGELVPVDVIVQAPPGKTVFEPETIAYLHDFTRAMERHPRVAAVRGLTSWNPAFDRKQYQAFYRVYGVAPWLASGMPFAPLVSREGATSTLVRIHPRDLMTLEDTQAILAAARRYAESHPERRVEVGGVVARVQDFTHELYRHLGAVLALVVGGVGLILAFYMRSVVLPLKAAVMNFLPILASLGVLTLLFQDGWLGGLLHTPHNGAVTNIVPLILFCIVFGLSMDYEVLILSRITEAYARTKDLEGAVVEGLSRSGSLITGAALILLGVFATGIFSSSPQTQEICWGISVAILIDATIVRLLLVPSFMVLLGRWNWWLPFSRTKLPAFPVPDREL